MSPLRRARRPALSAADADLALLGRQRGRRTRRRGQSSRRSRSRRSAGRLRSLVLLPFVWSTLRAELPLIRRHFWHAGAARLHQRQRLQHAALLEPSPHDGDQCHADAVDRPAPDRALELAALSRAAHAPPARPESSFRSPASSQSSCRLATSARLARLSLNIGDIVIIVAIGIYGLYSDAAAQAAGDVVALLRSPSPSGSAR